MRKQSFVAGFTNILNSASEKSYDYLDKTYTVLEMDNVAHGGTFRAKVEVSPSYNREELEKELMRRARAANRVSGPTGVERRNRVLQSVLAYIGEHRELIPFLDYVASGVARGEKAYKVAQEYTLSHSVAPGVVSDCISDCTSYKWYIDNKKFAPPLEELLKELPRVPLAWRKSVLN